MKISNQLLIIGRLLILPPATEATDTVAGNVSRVVQYAVPILRIFSFALNQRISESRYLNIKNKPISRK